MAIMTRREKDEVFSMAEREDVRLALVDEHSDILWKIVINIRTDDYNVLRLATRIKSRWEGVAYIMNTNHNLTHQDFAELMAVIIRVMEVEFKALGYTRKEFLDICSELQ